MPAASEEKESKDAVLSADWIKGFLLFWVLVHFSFS